MKKIFLLIILLSSIFFNTYSFYLAKITKDNINVRLDSTAFSPSLGYLNKDEIVKVLEEKFDWCKIILPQRFDCYVSSEFLEKVENNKFIVTASILNLRTEPSTSSYIIGKVKKNKKLYALKKENSWLKVKCYPFAYGWVHKTFLRKISSKKDFVSKKIIVLEGYIYPFKKENCIVNYLLKTGNANFLIKIPYIFDKKILTNKIKITNRKIKIIGKEINDRCKYLEVLRISFRR